MGMASTGWTKAMNNTQGCLLKHVATSFCRRALVMGQHAAARNLQKNIGVLLGRVAVQHGQAAGVRVMAFSVSPA